MLPGRDREERDVIADAMDAFLAAHHSELIYFRRHLHQHPELAHLEHETTAMVSRRLEAAGLHPRLLTSGTGLVCEVGAGDGPVVALRADLDALPLRDEKEVPYRSRRQGMCHACGHDLHTTVLLGVGLALAERAERLGSGRVRLVFQPAEETARGSLSVIEDGYLDDVDVIYGLHCDPKLEVGELGTREGAITAACDHVDLLVSGPGGHTGRPHATADVIYATCRCISELPAALSRLVDARSALGVTFGALNAGSSHSVMPTRAVARGTVRVLDRQTWQEAPALVERVVAETVAPLGVSWRLDYQRGSPPVVNDREATAVLRDAAVAVLGDAAVLEAPQSLGGEDFAWYLERVPGSLARLGTRIPGTDLDLHAGQFDADERAIPVGIRLLAETAVRALAHYDNSRPGRTSPPTAPGEVEP
jgi:amidohydrolase